MIHKEQRKCFIPRVNLITMRMNGHSCHSGYDRLLDYMQARHMAPSQKASLGERLIGRCFRGLISRSDSVWYHRAQFYCEIKAAGKWLRSNREIFHFIYGENSYQYLAKLKKIKQGNRIVCTYHTPPKKFETIVKNTKSLHDIDAIITVSSVQKDYFADLLGHHKVCFVPHGIDTDYFKPGHKKSSNNGTINCIFVGSHLRDIKTLKKIIDTLNYQNQNVFFHIVSKPETNQQLRKHANVQLYNDVSDHQLLELYQKSDVLILPLIDSTANNTILEAIACGLPVITTDLPGTRDYLSEDCALFAHPGSAEDFVEHIVRIKNTEYRNTLKENSRRQAQKFDWKIVADSLMDLYLRII